MRTSLSFAHITRDSVPDDRAAPKLIAFESIYSMDGDFGPIAAICDLAEKYNADAEKVASLVVVSTLLSVITIPLTLAAFL